MIHAIALSFVKGLSCKKQRALYEQIGSPKDLFALSRKALMDIFHKPELVDAIASRSTMVRAEEELAFCEKHHVRPLFYTDEAYPRRLNLPEAEDTPPLIYAMGDANLNADRVIAVVGTRHASAYGQDLVRHMMEDLRDEGVLVVSGLAYGIDAAAHTQSIANGIPTVGVVAHGFDRMYPAQNRDLARQMVQGCGGMVTEYPSRTRIVATYFPARNRIVAALSDAVVVVESAKTGGSLITADLAFGYSREVFAFPGRVGDVNSEGTNRLIFNNKAALIQSADDLLNSLNWNRRSIPAAGRQQELFSLLSPEAELVCNAFGQRDVLSIGDLMEATHFPIGQLSTILLNLELQNLIQSLPGRSYRIVRL